MGLLQFIDSIPANAAVFNVKREGKDIADGVAGSSPLAGGRGTDQYLNWATRLSVNASVLKGKLRC